ncbi:MAM domain protein [Necator americanus]|uniref:MAM domain protein n=1 Tax=Necator americanus TaxID=51031 RepID=W2SLI4_NECAM|nr:MAM domain protein [Necator americanus]ETN69597.1 MAM domain protein [Necator americanus]
MKSIAILLISLPLAPSQLSSIDCTFEHNLCGWTAESPWTVTDRTYLPSPLNLTPMTLIGDGSFVTAQGHFGSNTTADLISPLNEPSQALCILSFKYTKTIGDAHLQIMLKEGGSYRNLDTISTNMLAFWIRRTLVIPPTNEPFQIVFRVSKLRTGFDFISIDDIMLRSTGKNVLSVDEDLIRTFDHWKLLNGKIVTEGQTNAWLSSEPVLLPMNAHFELDIFASESSAVSVYQKFGAEETLIWTQSGITLSGWNRIRLPLRISPLPSKLLIKSSTRQGQLVAITNTNIVDESGRDLACGGNLQVIRPRSDDLIRLTAIQKLDSTDTEATTTPTLHVVSTTTQPTSTLRPIAAQFGPPVAPPIAPPIQNSFSISSPSQNVASPIAVLPISPAQDLLSGMAGHPVFEGQLKYLAKKLGFDRMSGEQATRRLGQIQRMLAGIKQTELPDDKHRIFPVNAKETDSIPPDLMSRFTSLFPSSRTINGALTNKITQPPRDYGDDSKPFSRNNMDFVIQNAYNAYMSQARP